MAKKEQPQQTFEDALKRLEEVLDALEHGELNLEEAVKAFEDGVERRVDLLLKDEAGRFITKPFPEEEGEGGG